MTSPGYVDLDHLKRLILLICQESEPYKEILAKSLGGVSIKMDFTDISYSVILIIDEKGIIRPKWETIETDLTVSASKKIWDDIFTSKVDYKQAYLTGKLRAKGSMSKLLKGSRSLGALIKVSKKVETAIKEGEL
jgi:putative sterol carrier protein